MTGGAGFIGSHIAEALVRRGDKVRVLDNLSTGKRANLAAFSREIEFIEGDLNDLPLVERRCAAWSGVSSSRLAVRAAEPAAAPGHAPRTASPPRFICWTPPAAPASAAWSMRRPAAPTATSPSSRKRETDLPQPLSPYAAAKLAGEYYCQAFFHSFGLETVGLRYFNVFGPRQDPGSPYSAVIPLFITAMLQGRQPVIYGDGRQIARLLLRRQRRPRQLAGRRSRRRRRADHQSRQRPATDLLTLLAALNRLLGLNVQPRHEPPRVGDVRDSTGRHHPGPPPAGLRGPGRFRRGPAAVDRLLPRPSRRLELPARADLHPKSSP